MRSKKNKLWLAPWLYKESFIFVVGILTVGFILQFTLGSFDCYILKFPVNLAIGTLFILFPILFLLIRKTTFYNWFTGVPLSVSLISALLLLGLAMGLIPQVAESRSTPHSALATLGFDRVTSSWPFILTYLITLLSLGTSIVRRLANFTMQDYAFYLNHIGLWILLLSAGLGAADFRHYIMYVKEGEVEWLAFNKNKKKEYLPIAIQLNDFDMEVYPPKLALINRSNGKLQPESKPGYLHMNEKKRDGVIADWKIELEDYIHQAIPDSNNGYQTAIAAIQSSVPAAKVKVTHITSKETYRGWVSYGNTAHLYRMLPLDSLHCIFMTQPQPKRFSSDINVFMEDRRKIHAIVEVNKPLKAGSWTIYQFGYDSEAGRMSGYSSFELVYDPWLYPVYSGIILLVVGSLCLICFGNKKRISYDLE